MISFRCSVADNPSAIKRSGKLEGGGQVTFDVPETDVDKLATLMALVLVPLEITVRPLADISTGEMQPETRKKGRRIEKTEDVLYDEPAPVPDASSKSEMKRLLTQLGNKKGAHSPEETFGGGGKNPLPRPDADKVI